ncbi:hypothetical protein [Pedobacter jamesrossensis]|uniref:CvpA family protein n=1 Tax=Pedobacter jamesrossensis TaxID=1908238 RepID=A0ABV8NMM5_9SPHI
MNLNIKAVILAFVLLVFTYKYYVRTPGSFMSILAVFAVGAIALAIFVSYFFGIKLIAYFINNGFIYPKLIFNILWPFIVLTFVTWIIYGFIYIKPFGLNSDFIALTTTFIFKNALFIAICSILIGITLSFPPLTDKTASEMLMKKNILYLVGISSAFLFSIVIFYLVNKINQTSSIANYTTYQKLDDLNNEGTYTVQKFIVPSENNFVGEPYVLPNKNELIIISDYGGNNRSKPIQKIYRIDTNGKIIAELEATVVEGGKFFPLICKNGILTDYDGKQLISWIFDGNKEKQPANSFRVNSDWKIDSLKQDTKALKLVHFLKTGAFHCNNIDEVKYNGNNYYELSYGSQNLKFRIDSIYTQDEGSTHCEEKKVELYNPPGFNFGLIRFNEHEYYIIKPKN